MTPLEKKIRRLIDRNGPISVNEYMAICLYDPDHGYYTHQEPFGVSGDFTTAPEISQLFGEMIGVWLVLAWQAYSRPEAVRLVEIGPGRGTLMADVQRVIGELAPDLLAAANAHLVETSPRLRAIQQKTLKTASAPIHWHKDLDEIENGFTLLFSNELFDAIPIRQFVYTDHGWRERTIIVGNAGKLAFQAGPAALDPPAWAQDASLGQIIEIAPAREALMSRIGARLVREGGSALAIDYGHDISKPGETLQAVRRHRYADVLSTPGECDLTSHVDFEALANAARLEGAHVWPVISQGQFLISLGLLERAGALGAQKTAVVQNEIRHAANRLAGTGSGQMGNLFRVLCLGSDATPVPPFGDATT
ncbi:MAG: class I SAM-dependent methyltransferase [Pseudomonadota bacterium]